MTKQTYTVEFTCTLKSDLGMGAIGVGPTEREAKATALRHWSQAFGSAKPASVEWS